MSSKYGQEEYARDKLVVDAAQTQLNALAAGEQDGRLGDYIGDYLRIRNYFEKEPHMMKPVGRMFHTLVTAVKINGFQVKDYDGMLQLVHKKLKGMRKFFRKPKIKCFAPTIHPQPCFCARLAAFKALEAAGGDEDAQARINGLLAIEREMEDLP